MKADGLDFCVIMVAYLNRTECKAKCGGSAKALQCWKAFCRVAGDAPAVGLPAVGGTNPAKGGANLHPEVSG